MIEIQGILNIRPLTYVNFEDSHMPNLFRFTNASLNVPVFNEMIRKNFLHTNQIRKRTYQILDKHPQDLRYILEHMGKWVFEQSSKKNPNSTFLSKRCSKRRAPRIVNEPEIPRGIWKLATIKEIERERDGEVRSVSVELPQGKILNRSVNMLHPLEINDEGNSNSQPTVFNKSIQSIDSSTNVLQD